MINEKIKLMKASALIIAILYIGLNFANIDAIIPQYNIYRYKQDPSKDIDVSMFYELSSSMIPQAQKLADDPLFKNDQKNAVERSNLNELLKQREIALKNSKWQNFNISEYIGYSILEKAK